MRLLTKKYRRPIIKRKSRGNFYVSSQVRGVRTKGESGERERQSEPTR